MKQKFEENFQTYLQIFSESNFFIFYKNTYFYKPFIIK